MLNQISDTAPEETIETNNHLKTKYLNKSHISLNITSQRLEAIKNALKETPEVDESRISFFKSEIALSHYEIDNDKIARSMLNIEPK
jgi:negative regulator of flagellin synthesis FlgM